MLGNPHDAEEVAQDALVRAYRALGRLRRRTGSASCGSAPWLATIVVNLCRNRARRHPVPTTPLDAARRGRARARREPPPPTPAHVADRRRRPRAPRRALATLPDRYRIPVVLRHVDDLSYAELVRGARPTRGHVKAQVSRGLAMLRAAAAGTELEELTA